MGKSRRKRRKMNKKEMFKKRKNAFRKRKSFLYLHPPTRNVSLKAKA